MPHLYEQVEGWFTYSKLYDEMVEKYYRSASDMTEDEYINFIEIGCWFGKSSLYLKEKISECNSLVALTFVDTWLGGKGEPEETLVNQMGKDYVHNIFLSNINKVIHSPTDVLKADSVNASRWYDDEYFEFIFIDAGHRDWQCYDDMVAWFPKLRNGGTIAGHDADYPDVLRSVERFCAENNLEYKILPSPEHCWIIEK